MPTPEQRRRWAETNQRYRLKRKLMGGCMQCARMAEPDAAFCAPCAVKIRAYNRSRYLRNRLGVKMGKIRVTEVDRQRARNLLLAIRTASGGAESPSFVDGTKAMAAVLAEIREEAILCAEVRAERVVRKASQHKGGDR